MIYCTEIREIFSILSEMNRIFVTGQNKITDHSNFQSAHSLILANLSVYFE
jgi:hypothetical protein